jgi:hypothetical protein
VLLERKSLFVVTCKKKKMWRWWQVFGLWY